MAAANRVRRLNIPTLEPTFPFWPSNPEIVVHHRIPIWGALRFTCRAQADFASRRSSTQWGGGHYRCFTSERYAESGRARRCRVAVSITLATDLDLAHAGTLALA